MVRVYEDLNSRGDDQRRLPDQRNVLVVIDPVFR